MFTPNSRPLRPARPAAAHEPLPILLDGGEPTVELDHESSEAVIRYQQVRAGADHSYLGPLPARPGEQLGEHLVRVRAREEVARPPGADGREAGERIVDRHVLWTSALAVHAVSLLASSSTSPAPMVRSRSPSPSSARSCDSESSSA